MGFRKKVVGVMVQNSIRLSKCTDYCFERPKEISPLVWAIAILLPAFMILCYMFK